MVCIPFFLQFLSHAGSAIYVRMHMRIEHIMSEKSGSISARSHFLPFLPKNIRCFYQAFYKIARPSCMHNRARPDFAKLRRQVVKENIRPLQPQLEYRFIFVNALQQITAGCITP